MADRARFAELAMPYMDQFDGAARRMTRNDASAEDLVQETYLRADKGFDRSTEGTNLRTWLSRSAEDELFDGLTSAEVRDAIEALPDSCRVAGPRRPLARLSAGPIGAAGGRRRIVWRNRSAGRPPASPPSRVGR